MSNIKNKMEEYLLDEDFWRGCNNFEKEFNLDFNLECNNKKENEGRTRKINS